MISVEILMSNDVPGTVAPPGTDLSVPPQPLTPQPIASDEIEKEIGDLVKKITARATPNDVAKTIGEHTKAILSSTTTQARAKLAELQDTIHEMDAHLAENEHRLRGEIDHHVHIAVAAQGASNIIGENLKNWRDTMKKSSS